MEIPFSRPCDYKNDLDSLMSLWLDQRVTTGFRVYPTTWRLRLLLTSRVWDPARDTRIWEAGSGQMLGFAMLWRRQPTSPYIVLDCFTRPGVATEEYLSESMAWCDHRAHEMAKEQNAPLTVHVNGLSHHEFSKDILKRYGYAVQAPNADEYNVYYARSLQTEIPPAMPLQGIVIRKLQGSGEMEAYQDLFDFSIINPHHLQELLESKEYCHWVMEDPRGGFVAYCECSICSMDWERSGERIGWIDYIETKPDYQNKGFGQAILLAGLHQLQELGADTAMLVTINTNTPAINLYKKTGFIEVENLEKPGYIKQIPTPGSEPVGK